MDMSLLVHQLIIFSMVLVVMLIFFFLLRKVKFNNFAIGKKMKLIQCMPVGTKDKILLLEVMGRHVMVGVSSSGMRKLHVFMSNDNDEKPDFSKMLEADFTLSSKNEIGKITHE